MGRPKGSRNKPKLAVVGGSDAAGPGHNSGTMTDDQLQALTRQHAAKRARLLDTEKTAKAERMNFDKVIKADLGPKGLADIKLIQKLETPEGEAELKAEMERQARVARWCGLSIGTQGSLFGEDRRPVEERAFDDGKRDGMAGKTLSSPHAAGTEAFNKYVEGWHAGQAVLAGGFQKKEPDAELLREEGKEPPAKVDEFDGAADGDPWPDDVAVAERETADAL